MKEGTTKLRDNVKGGALTEVTFFILLSVYTPRHGYAIMQFIEGITRGRLLLGAGTLYGALTALQKKGWIISFENDEERKKEYVITSLGEKVAEKELFRLRETSHIAAQIIGGKDHG